MTDFEDRRSAALRRQYAELAVRVGANVAPGQYVLVDGLVEHAPLLRDLAFAAYSAGAGFVDVRYADLHVKREMIDKAPGRSLTFTPPWITARLEHAADVDAALILVTGDPDPDLFRDLDPDRVGRAHARALEETHLRIINEKAVSWTLVACPTAAWARRVYGEPAVARLWRDVCDAVRLADEDPIDSWQKHLRGLAARAAALNAADLDSVEFRGPGTDLSIGLLPASRWQTAESTTRFGRRHVVNLPTEEVFTAPDRARADGHVRVTRDLVLNSGIVRGLDFRLEAGRITDVRAKAGEDLIRAMLRRDDGAARIGEVALVDGDSRVGRLHRVFFNGLFDENATSHLACGSALVWCVEGAESLARDELVAAGINQSSVHTDFMVGDASVDIYGVTVAGQRVPIVVDGHWRLGEPSAARISPAGSSDGNQNFDFTD